MDTSMDIVEFAERFTDVKLPDWQKRHLRELDKLTSEGKIHIVMVKNQGAHVFLNNDTLKELVQNG